MEFGTKLKTVREQKGITQQTLANYLFVSRQSVSRWESGSRYPDLMTAKKISEYFKISLDELISGDDIRNRQEIQPIMATEKAGRIQTAVYTAALLLIMIFALSKYYSSFSVFSAYLPLLLPLMLFLVYAVIRSVQKSLVPKLAGILTSMVFLLYLLTSVPGIFIGVSPLFSVISLAAGIFGIYASVSFFFREKCTNPVLFYTASVLSFIAELNIISNIYTPSMILSEKENPFAGNEILVIALFILVGMSVCQAHILSRKRIIMKNTDAGIIEK